jgi:hypothetical protein
MNLVFSGALMAIGAALVAFAGIAARRRIVARRVRLAAEEVAAQESRRLRLLSPDWDGYERKSGRRVPPVLRRLYADADLVTAEDLVVTVPDRGESPLAWEIASFEPVHAERRAQGGEDVPASAFHFAANWYGDPYYVLLGERPDGDGRVFVRFREAEEPELVAPCLAEFLSWPRHRAAAAEREV